MFRIPHLAASSLAMLSLLFGAGSAQAKPPAAARPFKVLPGVRLSSEVEQRISRLARRFAKKTGRPLVITSGTRSPGEQAAAMYAKLSRGRNLLRLYRRTSLARAVIKIYRKGRRKRWGWRATQAAMARVLRAQVARGEHLSQHLRSGAVDVRSRTLSRKEKRIFRRLVRKERDVDFIKEERVPPHFHLEVYTPSSPRGQRR